MKNKNYKKEPNKLEQKKEYEKEYSRLTMSIKRRKERGLSVEDLLILRKKLVAEKENISYVRKENNKITNITELANNIKELSNITNKLLTEIIISLREIKEKLSSKKSNNEETKKSLISIPIKSKETKKIKFSKLRINKELVEKIELSCGEFSTFCERALIHYLSERYELKEYFSKELITKSPRISEEAARAYKIIPLTKKTEKLNYILSTYLKLSYND